MQFWTCKLPGTVCQRLLSENVSNSVESAKIWAHPHQWADRCTWWAIRCTHWTSRQSSQCIWGVLRWICGLWGLTARGATCLSIQCEVLQGRDIGKDQPNDEAKTEVMDTDPVTITQAIYLLKAIQALCIMEPHLFSLANDVYWPTGL